MTLTDVKKQLQIHRRLVIFSAVVLVLSAGIAVLNRHQVQGDEPHYLVMTNSLIKDGDLNLRNDYEQMRYLDYYHMPLEAHVSSGKQPKTYPHWYSVHGAGVPFLIVGPVALVGAKGALAVMLTLGLSLLALAGLWTYRITKNDTAVMISVAALFSSTLFTGIFGFIFPDMPIAVLLMAALLLATTKKLKDWHLVVLGLVIGAAAWVHFKTILTLSPIGLMMLIRIWRQNLPQRLRIKQSLLIGVPWFSLVGCMLIKFHQWYNIWIPSQVFPPTSQLANVSPFVTLPALMFDSTKGLFVFSPALLLILVGLPLWYKLHRRSFSYAMVAALPSVAILATFSDWTGGFAPSGRYILEFLPVLVPAVGLLYMNLRTIYAKSAVIGLLAVNALLSLILVKLHSPTFINSQPNPIATEIQRLTSFNMSALAPQYSLDALVHQHLWLVPWSMLAVACLVLGYRIARKTKPV